jgi:hypothetical protein
MSTIRSVKSSSGGAGVLAIERRFSLCRVAFQSGTGRSHCDGDTLQCITGPY